MVKFLKNLSLVYQSVMLFRDEKLKSAGISGYQARYLLAVSDGEGLSQEALAKRLLVNKSNVARQVGALERAGYLKRGQSGEDRRVSLVYITQKGREIVPVIRAANEKWREVLCRGFKEGESEQLANLLCAMVENARAYLEDGQ